jgi:hypothetical protein
MRGYLLTFSFVKKVKLAFLFYLPRGKEEKADWQLSKFFFFQRQKGDLPEDFSCYMFQFVFNKTFVNY